MRNGLSIKKSICFIVMLSAIILFIVITVAYNGVKLWNGLFIGSNVNRNLLAVDSVWYNPENGYHNDTLLNTVLADKTLIYNSDGWYTDYFEVFAKQSKEQSNIPEFVDIGSIKEIDFYEAGYCLAYIHSTLVDHSVYEKISDGEIGVPKLFIETEGMESAKNIVCVNDENGNIYVMTEEYWNEVY